MDEMEDLADWLEEVAGWTGPRDGERHRECCSGYAEIW